MTTLTTAAPVISKPVFATREQYEKLLTDAGIAFTVQSGFIKVEPVKGRRLYVAATKTVRRVDLSGFELELEHGMTMPPVQGVFGNVKQQMKIEGTADEQLERFGWILTHLLSLDPRVSPPRAPKTAASSPAPSPTPAPEEVVDGAGI